MAGQCFTGRKLNLRGFSILESLVAIVVVTLSVGIMVGLMNARTVNRSASFRSQASVVADEELNALRRLPVANLTDQTGAFKNVLYNRGFWDVVTDNTDSVNHSVPNVLELPLVSGLTNVESGRLQFPAGVYTDPVLSAKWKVISDSTSNSNPTIGWVVGYWLRSRDVANGYRLRLAENSGSVAGDLDGSVAGVQNVMFEKLIDGTDTKLQSANVTLAKDTWYEIELSATGSSFTVKIGTTTIMSTTDSENSWTSGAAALSVWNGAHVEIDDPKTVAAASCAATTCWDFDTPAAPTMPVAWVRFGLNDIVDGTPNVFEDNGLLTIAPYPDASSTNLKQVTITITWAVSGATRSYTTTALIGSSGTGT